MPNPSVLVVAETPSLARSLACLLESAEIASDTVAALEGGEATAASTERARHPLIIAASSGPFCVTARLWVQGGFPGTELIVVGSRDPNLPKVAQIRQVDLPLRPDELLGLVRERLSFARSLPSDRSGGHGRQDGRGDSDDSFPM